MKIFKVKLNTIKKVKEFCSLASGLNCKIILQQNFSAIDAKSILGIFSLNLLKPINVFAETNENLEEIFKDFITTG